MGHFDGTLAVVTGGATGIGREIAGALLDEGARVVIASTNEERLRAAADVLKPRGDVEYRVLDVVDADAVEQMVTELSDTIGPIDLFVANAGVTTTGPYFEHRREDWEWVLGVNLQGVVNCVQAVYPRMVERGAGQLVLTGSQVGMVPDWIFEHGPYVPAKAAVHALGSGLRAEGKEHGVKVSVFLPAGVTSDILQSERSRPGNLGEPLNGFKRKTEVRRIGPEEAAARFVDGVKRDAPWIVTHAENKDRTRAYFNEILAAYDAADAFEYTAD